MNTVIFESSGWNFSSWQDAWPDAHYWDSSQLENLPNADFIIILAGAQNWLEILAYYKGKSTPSLVLSRNENPIEFQQAFLAGARGYIAMNSKSADLLTAYQSLKNGALWLPPAYLNHMISVLNQAIPKKPASFTQLSTREQEISQAVCQGLSNKVIAQTLGIGERTVKQHLTNIFTKLNISDRMQLLLLSKNTED